LQILVKSLTVEGVKDSMTVSATSLSDDEDWSVLADAAGK
jgi:hypothetical protein